MATPERVVIAAAGVVTPIGQDLEGFWSSLVTGASGISQIERGADHHSHPCRIER